MYNKVGYTIVGLFVIIFSAGMIWFAFWLNKSTGPQTFNAYTLHMKDSVSGLSKDATVKLHGVNVGRVKDIRIDPENIEEVEVILLIDKAIPIKEDMVAHTQMVGVTGMLAIEIDGGSNEAKTLKSGDKLSAKASLFSTLSSKAGPMVEDISSLVKKTDIILTKSETLFSKENTDNIAKILANIAHMTSRTDAIEARVFHTLDEADTTMKDVQSFMDTLKPQLIKVSKEFSKATKEFSVIQKDFHLVSKESVPLIKKLKQTTVTLARIMKKVEKSLDRGDYNMKKILEPMLVDVQMLVKQISTISRTLEHNPSDLLFKSRKHRKAPGE